MSESWTSGKLGDFITLQRGYDLPAYEREAGTIPVITSSGVNDTHSVAKAKGPGVIMGRYGTIGEIYYIKTDYWPHNTTLFVKDFKGNYPHFFYYFLKTLHYQAHNDKTSVPGLNRNDLHLIDVAIPPLAEQYAIAEILGSLDDKIELNRRMNTTLEAAARALFKSWFVDFDPVHSKARGDQPPGMDAETAALFPDSFDDSELGLIPAGWMVEALGKIANVVDYVANGSFASLKENVTLYDDRGYALFLRTTDFKKDFSGPFKFVDKDAYEFLSKTALNGSETIISNVGDTGTVFRPPIWMDLPMTLGSNAIAIRSNYLWHFTYHYFSSDRGQSDIGSIVSGSAQPKFNKTDFRSLRLIVPTQRIAEIYNELCDPLLQHQIVNGREIRIMTETRDALLPKLVSGQIRVSNYRAEEDR